MLYCLGELLPALMQVSPHALLSPLVLQIVPHTRPLDVAEPLRQLNDVGPRFDALPLAVPLDKVCVLIVEQVSWNGL